MSFIRTYNNIAEKGLDVFTQKKFHINLKETEQDEAILLRSYNLPIESVGNQVKIVARAGIGINNLPVDALTKRGVVVVNTPGANANAVKELVLAVMIMGKRHLSPACLFAKELQLNNNDIKNQVEAGKKQFSGAELVSSTLGVIGLGSIGVQVANSALALGMSVVGYDPNISIKNSWQLSAGVKQAQSLNEVLAASNVLTVHVPLNENTRELLTHEHLQCLPQGAMLLNFARDEIISKSAIKQCLESNHLARYLCDFPDPCWSSYHQVTTFPHLGASTEEAEANCAYMAATQIVDYLQTGTIRNSVNLPDMHLDPVNADRLTIIHENVPKMVSSFSTEIAKEGLNINQLYNKSRGSIAYTVFDLSQLPSSDLLNRIKQQSNVYNIRVLKNNHG